MSCILRINKSRCSRVIEGLKNLFNNRRKKCDIFDSWTNFCIQPCIWLIFLMMQWNTLRISFKNFSALLCQVAKKLASNSNIFNILKIAFDFIQIINYFLMFCCAISFSLFCWMSILRTCMMRFIVKFSFILFIDHAEFDSTIMYEHFYQKICKHVLKIFCENFFFVKHQNQCIKNYFIDMFTEMQKFHKNVTCIHKATMNKLQIPWQKIFNNRLCMLCIRKKSKNVFICDDAICDTCVWNFEERLSNRKYQYKLECCFFVF